MKSLALALLLTIGGATPSATAVFGLGVAHAQADASAAQSFLQQRHERVEGILRQRAGTSRNRRLSEALGDLLDYEELSKRALNTHWEGRSADEREQFVSLLRQLVQQQYESNLQRTMSYDVAYEGADARGDTVTVRTVARSRTNGRQPPLSIDYRMHQVDGEWRVFDILTDGVSLVRNYRTQFNRIIQRDGWDGLIQRMRDRL